MLHYLEKDDWGTGLSYLFKAAEQGYELAYGGIGAILYLYEKDILPSNKKQTKLLVSLIDQNKKHKNWPI